jgi:hypothetical protein
MISEPTAREESLCTQIAVASVTALLTLCWMLTFMIVQSALENNAFRDLQRDPGVNGLTSLVYIVPFYALLPVCVFSVRKLKARVFRWIVVAFAGFALVFWILHHLSHWLFGQRPTFSSHVVDLTLHAVGLWMLVNAIKWAKPPAQMRVDPAAATGTANLQQP